MFLRNTFVAGLSCGLAIVALCANGAEAGKPAHHAPAHHNTNKAAQPKTEKVTINGSLTGASGNQMMVTSDAKGGSKQWVVMGGPMTHIEATGTAKVEFLRPGLVVQFEANLDAHNAATEKVGKLKVISTAPNYPAGIVAGNLGKSQVTGQLKSVHGTTLTVHAGTKTAQIELTDDPTIDVSMNDGTFASPGDKVTVKGKAVQGKSVCEAQDVKITFAVPLTGPTKKTPLAHAEAKPVHHHAEKSSDPVADPATESKPKNVIEE